MVNPQKLLKIIFPCEAEKFLQTIKKAAPNLDCLFFNVYPEPVSNRHVHYWTQDFKSGASTNSAIWATLV